MPIQRAIQQITVLCPNAECGNRIPTPKDARIRLSGGLSYDTKPRLVHCTVCGAECVATFYSEQASK